MLSQSEAPDCWTLMNQEISNNSSHFDDKNYRSLNRAHSLSLKGKRKQSFIAAMQTITKNYFNFNYSLILLKYIPSIPFLYN
jgi:hypothetical protein